MSVDNLLIYQRPNLHKARMVMGLSGWMDGGDVSTGTIECLAERLAAGRCGEIEPEGFYICNFPGSMEISSLFRPHTKIEDGLITAYSQPENAFYCDERNNLVLFVGKEPNLRWEDYADCIFVAADELEVETIYFVGSVAGVVPHTRDPRLFSSVSDESMKGELARCGVRFSNYEGPASIVTFMTARAGERGIEMASLVAEIPAYIQGRNPRCIEAAVRHLAAALKLQIHLDDLRTISEAFEQKLNEIVRKRPELARLIEKLEGDYDSEVFDTQMGDLKVWLQQQGIRLD